MPHVDLELTTNPKLESVTLTLSADEAISVLSCLGRDRDADDHVRDVFSELHDELRDEVGIRSRGNCTGYIYDPSRRGKSPYIH